MANRCNMPVKQEQEASGHDSIFSGKLYKPLPYKAGEVVTNKILITLGLPNKWKIFNPTSENIRKYGLTGDPVAAEELRTFYFRLKVHDIRNFCRPDSSIGFSQVLCPLQFNKYLTEALGWRPLFENPRCAFCEAEQQHWDVTNERWEELGIDKTKLKKDGYWETIKADPVLSSERKALDSLQMKEKFVVPVFDHSKFIGARPKEEGEDQLGHQMWFAPRTVFDKLLRLYSPQDAQEQELLFFDPAPQGYPVLSIIKDTTKCQGNDMMRTTYDVAFRGEYYQYSAEWLNYLTSFDAQVDPSDFVFMITYEEGKIYAAEHQSSRNDYRAPVRSVGQANVPPGFTPPAMGFVPQASVPQNYYAPTAPVQLPPSVSSPAMYPPPAVAVAPIIAPPVPIQPPMTTPPAVLPPAPSAGVPMTAPPVMVPPAVVPPTSPVMVPGPAYPAVPNRVPPAGENPPGSRRAW